VKPSWVIPLVGGDVILDTGRFRDWTQPRALQRCDLGSGTCTALVQQAGPTVDPALSPDRQQLAYVQTDPLPFASGAAAGSGQPLTNSARWNASRRLLIAAADGTNGRVIADGGVIGPRWSRDGTHLIFAREGYLWLISTSGGPPTAITAVDENIASTYNATPFEQGPYIFPGDDVWTTSDWAR
jgi:hypothetical protein